MNCNRCGFPLVNGANNCSNCGASVGVQMNQPMNNQMMNQPMNNQMLMNNQMMNNPMGMSNRNNNKNSIAVIITIVICLVVAVGTILFVTSGSDSDDNGNTPVAVNNKNVEYNGFQFSVPNDYINYIENDLLIIEKTNDWMVSVNIATGYYESGNAALMTESFKRNGYQVLNYSKKTYSGVEFMIFELVVNGNSNGIVAYAKASSNQIYAIAAVNSDNSTSHKGLENLAPILKSAKSSSYTNSIKVDGSLSDINPVEYFVTE